MGNRQGKLDPKEFPNTNQETPLAASQAYRPSEAAKPQAAAIAHSN
jgi:hypothetical protein